MIKNINLFKIVFHATNLILIVLYLYPGSILGWVLYNDFSLQPQITKDYIISSNHFFAFFLLSVIGIFSHYKEKKISFLIKYLFIISIILEVLHAIIPERSFQFGDLFGNLLGVLVIVALYKFWFRYNN
jgi:hypothetical protein